MLQIKLDKQKFGIINLTKSLDLSQELYPGDPRPRRKSFSEIKKDGCQYYIHELGDHIFSPHVDAPNHQNPDRQECGVEYFGEDYYFNKAFMIDLSDSNRVSKFGGIKYLQEIKVADLRDYEDLFRRSSAVVLRSGYDKWLEKNKPHQLENIPFLTKEAAEYVASFDNIKVLGIDSLSVDAHGRHDSHQALQDIFIVESMLGLSQIPKKARKNFDLQTSPIIIVGATGAAVVANAFIAL